MMRAYFKRDKQVFLKFGTAPKELRDLFDEYIMLARKVPRRTPFAAQSSVQSFQIRYRNRALYDMDTMPEGAYVRKYALSSPQLIDDMHLLGAFEYPDEPYVLINTLSHQPLAADRIIKKLRHGIPGAERIFDAYSLSLDAQALANCRYTLSAIPAVSLTQDLLDSLTYQYLIEHAAPEMEALRKKLKSWKSLNYPASPEALITHMFDSNTKLRDVPVSELIDFHCKEQNKELVRLAEFPDELKVSPYVRQYAELVIDLYALVEHIMQTAIEADDFSFLDAINAPTENARYQNIRAFADSWGIDSLVSVYNSGVPIDDITA